MTSFAATEQSSSTGSVMVEVFGNTNVLRLSICVVLSFSSWGVCEGGMTFSLLLDGTTNVFLLSSLHGAINSLSVLSLFDDKSCSSEAIFSSPKTLLIVLFIFELAPLVSSSLKLFNLSTR